MTADRFGRVGSRKADNLGRRGLRMAQHMDGEFVEAVQGIDYVGLAGLILQEGAGERGARRLWRSSRRSAEGGEAQEDGTSSGDEDKGRLSAADAAGPSMAERFRDAYIWQRQRQRAREERLAAAEAKKALKSSSALRAMNQWLDEE